MRIGPDLLVATRHGVADERDVKVHGADGAPVPGTVIPTSFSGDLVLIRAVLPDGPVLAPGGEADGDLYVAGRDIQTRRIRVFPKGELLSKPEPSKPLARLHHTVRLQTGVSGGALVNAAGKFVAVAVSGGRGRYEAVPASRIAELKAASGEEHAARSAEIGKAYRECLVSVEKAQRANDALPDEAADQIERACLASGNRQLFDIAGQVLGRSRRLDAAVRLFERSVATDPNAVNARLGLVVTLIFARKAEAALPHVRWLIDAAPKDIQVQRFAVQVGKRAGDSALAEKGLALIGKYNPAELEGAKRFLEGGLPKRR